MLLMGWIEAARAGCTVDSDGDARRASAGLVVGGTVVQRSVVPDEDGHGATVQHLVRVDETWKGRVQSGFLILKTWAGGGFCPPDVVFDLGERVYAVGSPDDGATLPVSFCTRDTGAWTEESEAWLQQIPRKKGLSYAGAPAPRTYARVDTLPEPTGARLRVVRAASVGATQELATTQEPGEPTEGRLLQERGEWVWGLFELDRIELALWIHRDGLARSPVRRVELAPGLVLLPGAPLSAAGIDHPGISAEGQLSERDLGHTWTPEPPREMLPMGLASPTELRVSPSGAITASLAPGGEVSLQTTGAEREGWLPVELRTPWVEARGWVRASAVQEDFVTYGTGSGRGGRFIGLEPGVQLVEPRSGSLIGRVTDSVMVVELASGADWAYVSLDTPWGPLVAEARCAPLSGDEDCRPR